MSLDPATWTLPRLAALVAWTLDLLPNHPPFTRERLELERWLWRN
jgi:hypothetical protein